MSSVINPDEYDQSSLIFLLPRYYGKVFPTELMYRWLSYGDNDFFARREFSFTLTGDVYLRYLSFNNAKEFEAELIKRKPEKIDIGAVYNQRPRSRDTLSEFIPLQKEFVLDIDLTDYDDVRTCCKGARVCGKCWKFIAVAVKIMDRAMRDDFGFNHLLWVFSGRRGVHCWICDETAIKMDSGARSAILEYLTLIRGGESQLKKVKIPNPDKVHPFITDSLEIIDEFFEEICHEDQHMLEKNDKNFEILPAEVKQFAGRSTDRFAAVMQYISEHEKQKKSLRAALLELKLQLVYPRLDVNVSKDLNHLLKSPFCVHPKTGQICVPFDPEKVYEFQPSEAPSYTKVLEELGKAGSSQSSTSADASTGKENVTASPTDYSQTSLAPYMKVFEKFVKSLEDARNKAEKKKKLIKDSNLQRSTLDF